MLAGCEIAQKEDSFGEVKTMGGTLMVKMEAMV